MKGGDVIAAIVVALLITICMAITSKPGEEPPNIYVTRTDRVRTFEGSDLWILEYTVNGVMRAAMFDSPEALAEYREYLGAIGKVYRKEGGD
jgi:hypothetical protein